MVARITCRVVWPMPMPMPMEGWRQIIVIAIVLWTDGKMVSESVTRLG